MTDPISRKAYQPEVRSMGTVARQWGTACAQLEEFKQKSAHAWTWQDMLVTRRPSLHTKVSCLTSSEYFQLINKKTPHISFHFMLNKSSLVNNMLVWFFCFKVKLVWEEKQIWINYFKYWLFVLQALEQSTQISPESPQPAYVNLIIHKYDSFVFLIY